ncbi:MAG: hypothetical protein K6E19_02295, partial [Lachnospiraceae bacterium]|nr:hypothetical protein [Lachnospiraceae bacterium]
MSAKKNRSKTKSNIVKKDSKYWVNRIGSVYCFLIIVVMFVGMALFLPDEYYDVATWKFYYLINACKIIAIGMGFFLLVYFGGRGISVRDLPKFKPIVPIDIAMIVFLFFIGISYLCSEYQFVYDENIIWPTAGAFYGTIGWYIGFIFFAMLVMLYFILAHFLQYSEWVLVP